MASLPTILNLSLIAVAAIFLLPLTVFAAECLLASLIGRRRTSDPSPLPAGRIAVIIPAHNEEAGIASTLESLRPQLRPTDTLLVVADNCTDSTAAAAHAAGASVLERCDPDHRGKGYALDFGIRALEITPPDVVIFVDADCHVHPGSISALASRVLATARPCQAIYLMETPPDPSPTDRISAFAFRVKNLVRPLGLRLLGMPCLLTGTGMAFPWAMIRNAPLASGNIVEDMQLGLDLTAAGTPPLLCPDAQVTGRLPQQQSAAATQRTRWEHGHLHTIKTQLPRLLASLLMRPRLGTLAIALELSVPPLSLLVAAWTAASLAIAAVAAWFHLLPPLLLCAAGWLLLTSAVFAAWTRFARDILPFSTLIRIPFYIAGKLPLYRAFFGRRRETTWVRTARDTEPATPAQQIADHLLADAASQSTTLGIGRDVHTDLPHRVGRDRVAIGQSLIDNLTMDEAIASIEALIRRRRPTFVVTPNVDHVVKLQTQEAFRDAYRDAGLVLADGMPLLWAARLLGTPLKQKVSGSDLFPAFCDLAGRKGYRLFFLGGRPGAAERSAEIFRARHPNIQIQTYCPPLGFDTDPAENQKAIQLIRDFAPDVLFVGLGAPKQEHWMHRHHAECQVPVSIGIGGSFDFTAGHVRRAPVLLQKTGLEWTWRLMQEPRRMYRRYLIEDPQFLSLIWRQRRQGRRLIPSPSLPPATDRGVCPPVLIIAEDASAEFGGEAAIPLHLFRIMRRRGYPVHMIIHERVRKELERDFAADLPYIHFVPDTKWHIRLFRLSRFLPRRVATFTTGTAMHLLTQTLALRIARRLIEEQGIQIVHQPTPVSPKEWSAIHGLGVPVVMGPMNGGMTFPPGFRGRESRWEAIAIGIGRTFANLLNRLVPGKLRAATLMVANERTRLALPKRITGRVELLPENGVDLAVWKPTDRIPAAAADEPCKFVFTGRLVDWKAVDLLLAAVAESLSGGANITLDIVGDGVERPSLEQRAADLKITHAVRFRGWMPQRDCSEVLRNSDALILPSLYECGGAVVLEAMCVGLPVIATNWGGPADYLDPSCGILVDPTTPPAFITALADAMRTLAADPSLRRRLGLAGQTKVRREYDWDQKIDRIVAIYQETLARVHPSPASALAINHADKVNAPPSLIHSTGISE